MFKIHKTKFKKGPASNAFSIPASNASRSDAGWADAGGFTLIELLVVVAIISLLSSIVFASLNSARLKAYDARRIEELHNLVTDLTLYRDTYNANPDPGHLVQTSASAGFLQELVTSGLRKTNPQAPDNNSTNPYGYYDYGSGNTIGLLLVTQLEAAAPSTTGLPGTCRPWLATDNNWCIASSNRYYCLCNPY